MVRSCVTDSPKKTRSRRDDPTINPITGPKVNEASKNAIKARKKETFAMLNVIERDEGGGGE
jgi:hypothetical protein